MNDLSLHAALGAETLVRQGPAIPLTARPGDTTLHHLIQHLTIPTQNGESRFVLWDHQRHLLETLMAAPAVAIRSARNMGATALLAAYAISMARVEPFSTTLVVEDGEIAFHLQTFAKQCPDVVECTSRAIVFDNGAMVRLFRPSGWPTRGISSHRVIIDNAHRIPDHVFRGLWLARTVGSQFIVSSSAPHPGTNLGDLWAGSDGNWNWNSFARIMLPWFLHPEWDDGWEHYMRGRYGDEMFDAEFELLSRR